MKTFKNIELNQKAISIAEAKEFLLHTLNAQIQYQREKYLREWTKNNAVNEDEKNDNIHALTHQKQELFQLLSELTEEEINVNLSIEIGSSEQKKKQKKSQEMADFQ